MRDGIVLNEGMSNTATARPIDANQALAALRPARMEMGVRDAKCSDTALWVKVGMGAATAWVEITVNALDLYDVEIFKLRGATRTTLGTLTDVYADRLAAGLIAEWCNVCTRKGW